ncbi:MAG: winged helix-turn-helix domain-containing protein [Anaeroplasmataceae bacterium]|nr:winged helix-turn-helix domain-containing protein [Anaeroplasmataceae bacterium]
MKEEELKELKKEIIEARPILDALSSEVRQSIILELATIYPNGIRIGDIKMKHCITRPTMSHHMKLLYKAKLIQYVKKGTKNYYYLSIEKNKLEKVEAVISKLKAFTGEV